MGYMTIKIGKELEDEFRLEVAKRLGMKKGNLGIAIEEAIKSWIKS